MNDALTRRNALMSDQFDRPPASDDREEPSFDEPPIWLPGPGIFGAVGWIVVFLVIQVVFFVPAAIAGFDQGILPLALLVVSGLLATLLIVGPLYGADSQQLLALRGIPWSHF